MNSSSNWSTIDERVLVAPPPAGEEREGRIRVVEADERRSASGSPASWGASAWPRLLKGRVPGVHTIAAQPVGSGGDRPARRNEVLPAPDGPITPSRCGRSASLQTRLDLDLATEEDAPRPPR